MGQEEIEAFRMRYRVALIERIALKNALSTLLLDGLLSIEESRDLLKSWLGASSAIADRAYGEHFRDPAQTALYADEVKEIIDNMKSIVDSLAIGLQKSSGAHWTF
jgi:hypothetical protein